MYFRNKIPSDQGKKWLPPPLHCGIILYISEWDFLPPRGGGGFLSVWGVSIPATLSFCPDFCM
jgi:hypothetical protein